MAGPQVYLTLPKAFSPIPSNLPETAPPPPGDGTLRTPFTIPKPVFDFALQPWLPLAFAATYVLSVLALNAWNRSRDWKPWWVSRQKPFRYFVVAHNALLALYSAATFVAMLRAIYLTVAAPAAEYGTAGVADALCKMHGPRGMGDAVSYNTTLNIWETKNTVVKLADGVPDATDVGRLWNEGLAFWGWIFYISKFYEVVDTFIILAKGKRSATLQTYHHAGAMLCMWAGIRYMSPPIWMFVFINSFIHGLMYTYFALSALGVKIPTSIKRTLTTMQIAQFVFGASYAAAHLFVQYDIPIHTPYQVLSAAQHVASSASSAAASATSTVSEVFESPTPTASLAALMKKLLLRAAGEEGVAERVGMHRQSPLVPAAPELEGKVEDFVSQKFETRWRSELARIDCIDTTGEAFAVYLNLLYLAPLTFLFARFFVRAYTRRGPVKSAAQAVRRVSSSAADAAIEAEKSIEKAGRQAEQEVAEDGAKAKDGAEKGTAKAQEGAEKGTAEVKEETKDVREQLRRDVQAMKDGTFEASRKVQSEVQSPKKKETAPASEVAKKEGGETAKQGADTQSPKKEPASEAPKTPAAETQSPVQSPSKKKKNKKGGDKKPAPSDSPADDNTPVKQESTSTSKPSTPKPSTRAPASPAIKPDPEASTAPAPVPSAIATEPLDHPAPESEPVPAQDEHIAASTDLRPGSDEIDAMGQSGSLIDISAQDAADADADAQKA